MNGRERLGTLKNGKELFGTRPAIDLSFKPKKQPKTNFTKKP
jgi:hypothetical protein